MYNFSVFLCARMRTYVRALPRYRLPLAVLLSVLSTCSEWAVNQHRDSLASHIGHHDFLSFVAVAENESIGRVRFTMLEKMLSPCGVPPVKEED
jgi:hypothetical protein